MRPMPTGIPTAVPTMRPVREPWTEDSWISAPDAVAVDVAVDGIPEAPDVLDKKVVRVGVRVAELLESVELAADEVTEVEPSLLADAENIAGMGEIIGKVEPDRFAAIP